MTPHADRYNAVAVFMHWLTAFAIIGMLACGWIMSDMPKDDPLKFPLFQWHKSIGITILLLSVFRLVWRLTHTVPPLPDTLKAWEKYAAHGVHWLFYALLIIMPMTGWAIVSTSRYNIPTMLYGVIPWPHLPILPTLENKQEINHVFSNAHGFLAYLIVALLALHVGAALKHHVISRDNVLLRMAPKVLGGILKRFGGPRALGMALFALAISASPAHAKDWTVDYTQSKLGFIATQSGATFNGEFKSFKTGIDFDPEHPTTGKITAIIDIASVTAGNGERDAYLPQSDWFDTRNFPQATFVSTDIGASCDGTDLHGNCGCYSANGTLMIKGVAKSVSLPFCLKPEGDHWRAEGKIVLHRADYHIGTGQWSSDDLVKHAVDVTFSIAAKPN